MTHTPLQDARSFIAAEQGERNGDIPGTLGGNPRILPGDTFEGYLGNDDSDMVRINLSEGVTYELFAFGSGEGPLEDPTLELLDRNGTRVQFNDDFRPGLAASGIVFTPSVTGDYFLRIGASDGGLGHYTMAVVPDAADRQNQAAVLDSFFRIEGVIHGDEADWYAVELFSGGSIDFMAYGTGDAALTDVDLALFDRRGRELEVAVGDGDGKSLTFASSNDDLYFLRVTGGSEIALGVYEMRMTFDPGGGLSDTWFIREGLYYPGHMEAGRREIVEMELEAGIEYGFELYGPGTYGLEDPFLELLDDRGRVIVDNDDESEESFDSYIRFVPQESGTYYLRSSSADEDDFGRYWVHYRDLTNATLDDVLRWQDAEVTTTPIRVFLADDGVAVNDEGRLYVSDGFSDQERAYIREILDQIESFTRLEFTFTQTQEQADFQLSLSELDGTLLGFMNPQGSSIYSDGVGVLSNGADWTPARLQKGGLMNHVIAHELGHGLGLAHPHDQGGFSDRMLGVRGDEDRGDFGLNQVPFTVMTYNEYWEGDLRETPGGEGRGHLFGFGAIDMMVLQGMYGTNTNHARGDDIYSMDGQTWLETIWDTGGTDEIDYSGDRDVVIDLRAATAVYGQGGGGYVSYTRDWFAGFTIAEGVQIENASGGSGADRLRGNDLANVLAGGRGKDTLIGVDGDDTLIGNGGADDLWGGAGRDSLQGGGARDVLNGGGMADTLEGGRGNDTLLGGAGQDSLDGGLQNDRLVGGARNDRLLGGKGQDTLLGGNGHDYLFGGNQADLLVGGDGDDILIGGLGPDVFRFDRSDGRDRLLAFQANDRIDLSGLGLSFEDLRLSVDGTTTIVRFANTELALTNPRFEITEDVFLF